MDLNTIFIYVGQITCYLTVALLALACLSALLARAKTRFNCRDKHVIITGASTGLGRAVAEQLRQEGARLSIISRNPQRLETARVELQAIETPVKSNVFAHSADVCHYDEVKKAVDEAVETHGDAYAVICCAGLSHPGLFEDMDVGQFDAEMQLNYMGCVNTAHAIMPHWQRTKDSGERHRLVLVSSAVALVGFIGYSAYAPTKYAVRGLADTLRNELRRFNIDVTLFLPSSIDTPGYEQENRSKPAACTAIEDGGALLSKEEAARALLSGLRRGYYTITTEFLIELSRIGSNGVAPRNNTFLEMLIMPLIPLLHAVFVYHFDSFTKSSSINDTIKKKN